MLLHKVYDIPVDHQSGGPGAEAAVSAGPAALPHERGAGDARPRGAGAERGLRPRRPVRRVGRGRLHAQRYSFLYGPIYVWMFERDERISAELTNRNNQSKPVNLVLSFWWYYNCVQVFVSTFFHQSVVCNWT